MRTPPARDEVSIDVVEPPAHTSFEMPGTALHERVLRALAAHSEIASFI